MRYWKRLNPDNSIGAVESYWHDQDVPGAVEITQPEFDAFIASLPPLPPPPNWKAQWQAASTVADKIQVLAKKLGLE